MVPAGSVIGVEVGEAVPLLGGPALVFVLAVAFFGHGFWVWVASHDGVDIFFGVLLCGR